MYSCMGRVTRLGPVPASLKLQLFDAYVRPVMLYCIEALPFSKRQVEQLDSLQLQYIRWSLGNLPPTTPRVDTLAEAGQKPVSMEARKARIRYFHLVKARPDTHITTAAFHDARTATHKHDNWWTLIHSDMQEWNCDDTWTETVEQVTAVLTGNKRQAIVNRFIRTACFLAWRKQTQTRVVDYNKPPTRTDDPDLDPTHLQTRTLRIHLYDDTGARWHSTLFGTTHCTAAPYINVCMSSLARHN